MALAIGALGTLWVWDAYDKIYTSHLSKKYKTIPLPDTPTYHSGDVSIVVPTIETEPTFTQCVRLLVKSNPREIFIITVPKYKARVEELIKPVQEITNKITLLICPVANKRQQNMVGIKAATGSIIALVDDDAFWNDSYLISYMLAPFENSMVGGVSGLQSPDISPERQDASVVTVWEAGAALDMFNMNRDQPTRFAADGGVWVLSGRTVFIRAAILQDPHFSNSYTGQVVGRAVTNGADDVWVTSWILDHDWEICIQNARKAEILTSVPRDWKFLLQNFRWERGNHRSFLERLFGNPGFRVLMRKHPHLTRVMIEKLTRPFWTAAYVMAWFATLKTAPWLACVFIMWMALGLGGWIWHYRAFIKEYPYMAGKVWMLFLWSRAGSLMDVYTLVTMNDDRWLTRTADTQYVKEKGIAHAKGMETA